MKISKLRSFWIIAVSTFYTGVYSIKTIIMRLLGKADRVWMDKALQTWINKMLDLAGIKCKVINPHKVEPQHGKANIIMCNHSSLYDIPISFKAFPNDSIRMLAKKELAKVPLLGKGMKAAEFPFIDRKNRHQALRDLAFARQLMESGIIIWIAPEGTRSKDGKLAPFKKGAFITAIEAKANIIPICIRGAYDILPARTWQFNINQTAEIHIGEPIDASQYTTDKKDELVNRVYQTMKNLMDENPDQ